MTLFSVNALVVERLEGFSQRQPDQKTMDLCRNGARHRGCFVAPSPALGEKNDHHAALAQGPACALSYEEHLMLQGRLGKFVAARAVLTMLELDP